MSQDKPAATITILHDTQCPACAAWASGVASALPGQVELASAREHCPLRQRATDAGVDLDREFVVLHREQLLSGAAALHEVSKALPRRHWLQRALFGRLWLARLIYPQLVNIRRLLLLILRVGRINNLTGRRP